MGSMEVVKTVDARLARPLQESVFLPVMSMEVAVERRETIIKFVKQIMVEDQDFGVIPGTSTKPVLLKPGAEKLCNFFGLEPEFTPIFEEVDWTGEKHGGEPFYYIRYRCRLTRNGQVLGVGEGSCNSWESKYRYRNANRKCPECSGEFIIQGKEEYGGGWLCFKKKGGCGAKFGTDDKRIADQVVGRVKNPDMADAVNTIQKMAQKRALVPATLLATSGSEFFTQDLEDDPREGVDKIDTGGHAVGTQAAADAVRDRKLAEARSVPAQVAGQKGETSKAAHGGGQGETNATAPAIHEDVPVELRSLFSNLSKSGYARQGLELMKRKLSEAMPEMGGAEYRRIVEKHGLTASGGMKIAAVKTALLEMWQLAEFARAQHAKTVIDAEFQASDDDLPAGLFPETEAAYGVH